MKKAGQKKKTTDKNIKIESVKPTKIIKQLIIT